MSCDICTGLGDSWHYGPLPEPVHAGFLLVEFGYPDYTWNGTPDRDRFLFAGCWMDHTVPEMRGKWQESGGGNALVRESDAMHIVRWQWLRGEPTAAPVEGVPTVPMPWPETLQTSTSR